jgi:hypothetical protein
MGGARGFLPCRRSSDEDIAVEDFVAGVARVVSDVRADLVFRRFARLRKQVTFETALFSDSTGGIVAELRNLREATVLRADDASATIRFAGVPTERFADLVGHDRVKSRCKDCGGTGICQHKRIRQYCKDCKGGAICKHNNYKHTCRQCGGPGRCVHDRVRSK